MGRPLRPTAADVVYHVLNRANGRQLLFDDDGDYAAFERVLAQACERVAMRLMAYCIMPNHWHLVVWPRRDGDLSRFMNWLTLTHTQRWHQHRHTVGDGHVYQGRFKSFPVETSKEPRPSGRGFLNQEDSCSSATLRAAIPPRSSERGILADLR